MKRWSATRMTNMSYRLAKTGERKSLLAPNDAFISNPEPHYGSLWRQYYQYGFWKVRVLQKHPRQMRPRQFVPPLFVAALIGLSVLSIFSPIAALTLAWVVGLYILINLITSTRLAWKYGLRNMLFLPLAFTVLHISYGFGFLVGLIHFRKRWGDKIGHVPAFDLSLSKANPLDQ